MKIRIVVTICSKTVTIDMWYDCFEVKIKTRQWGRHKQLALRVLSRSVTVFPLKTWFNTSAAIVMQFVNKSPEIFCDNRWKIYNSNTIQFYFRKPFVQLSLLAARHQEDGVPVTDDDDRRKTKGMQKECNFHFMSRHDVHICATAA